MNSVRDRGFALITVLGVVLIVSAVALTLASTMRAEALQVSGERTSLELDQLASGGHEMALYLASRRIGTTSEDLNGLPVKVVRPGFHYVVDFPTGAVDLYLDAEDGKLNLSSAPEVLIEGALSTWSGDVIRARELTAVIKDWRDTDDSEDPGGAEKEFYLPSSYSPRNGGFGVADAGLLRGISPEDFRTELLMGQSGLVRRVGLSEFLTTVPAAATVNPNFAAELVLQAVPGLSPGHVSRLLAERKDSLFKDAQDLSRRIGLLEGSLAFAYFHFSRQAPAVTAVAKSSDGRVIRSDRRVTHPFSRFDFVRGNIAVETVTGLVDRNHIPQSTLALTP